MQYRILDETRLDAMRPLLRGIVDDLVAAYDEVITAAGRGDGSIERELDVVQRHAFEIEALGGTVRSLEPLAVEFPAEQDGAIGYLPWDAATATVGAFRSLEALCALPA